MNYRDFLQKLIYWVINPLVKGMIKVGITPNLITFTGLLGNVAAAALVVYGGIEHPGDLSYVGWGGLIILLSGLFDMMDGRVARVGNMSSTFGALFDSVLDRYSELITLFGFFYWLILSGYLWEASLPLQPWWGVSWSAMCVPVLKDWTSNEKWDSCSVLNVWFSPVWQPY